MKWTYPLMIKHLDEWDIAANVRFSRHHHKGAVFIVEGETDCIALERFVSEKDCIVEIAFGKKNAIGAIDLLDDEGFQGVLALVDADFDRLLGITHSSNSIVLSEFHDIEMDILHTSAFEHIIREYAEKPKLQANFGSSMDRVRNEILEACRPLSVLRLYNERRNMGLNFRDLSFDFIEESTLKCDVNALALEIISKNSRRKINPQQIIRIIASESGAIHDLRQITRGHDAAHVLGRALRARLSSRRAVHTWRSEIESLLRLSFDFLAFAATDVFRQIKQWEDSNRPFRVLSC